MNIAIIDDLQMDRQFLSDFVYHYCREHNITVHMECFESGETFLGRFKQGSFDIVFLDVYMKKLDGIETAEKIREKDNTCLLVFSTMSECHAVKSFRVRAFDYLVKPYSYEQFAEVMHMLDQTLLKRAHYIEVKESREWKKILLQDIIYTDYSNHYIQIHTTKRLIKTYMQFNQFSPLLLTYPQFLCCYRNCIININAVIRLDDKDFLMQNGERIPLDRSRRYEIRQYYANYMFEELRSNCAQ